MNTQRVNLAAIWVFLGIGLMFPRHAYSASVNTSASFATAWNSGATPITITGPISLVDSLLGFSGTNISLNGSTRAQTLTLGDQTLSFTPNWNDGLTASISNMTIAGATNTAVSFQGDGVGAHSFTIDNVIFQGNTSSADGGAIRINSQQQSELTNSYVLTNNNFRSNRANNGGAVFMASNNAMHSGGDPNVFWVSGDTGNTFSLNTATVNGGGIFFLANNTQSGVTSEFTAQGYTYFQNSAGGLGGAIYLGVLNGNSPAVSIFNLTGGTFKENRADSGGAIAAEINGGNTDISVNIDGSFQSNIANASGGAISLDVGNQYSPYGGYIAFHINGIFDLNQATTGGAIYANIQAGQASIVTNISGGLANNHASSKGGAIFNTSGNNNPGTSIVNIAAATTFSSNTATYGGAIFNSGNGVINFNTAADMPNEIGFWNNSASSIANGMGIFQDSDTAVINVFGDGRLTIGDGIGGIGTINQEDTSTLTLTETSDSSGFTGVFNNAAGTNVNVDGIMFGGQNNIAGLAGIVSGRDTFYFNANMLSGGYMHFASTTSDFVTIGQAADDWSVGLNFVGTGAEVFFRDGGLPNATGFFTLLEDISNGQSNTISFNEAQANFGSTDFLGSTLYRFDYSSTIDLATSSGAFQAFNFANLATDNSALLSFKIGTDDQQDTINVAAGGGQVNLGRVYIDDSAGTVTGTRRIITSDDTLQFINAQQQFVITSQRGAYSVTTDSYYYVILDDLTGGGVIEITLDDINMMSDTADTALGTTDPSFRSFQIGTGEVYQSYTNLHDMYKGIFNVHGLAARSRTSTLSGLNRDDGTTRQSLFNIVYSDTRTTFTMQDLIVENALSNVGGSVLNMNSSNGTAILGNLLIRNNESTANGGAINIGEGSSALINVDFAGNKALSGSGGAIFNSDTMGISGGSFIDNHAANGGAIFNASTNPTGSMQIQANINMGFSGNSATGQGGAIFNEGSLDLMVGSGATLSFSNNTADGVANDIFNSGRITIASTGGIVEIAGGFSGVEGSEIIQTGNSRLKLLEGSDSSSYLGAFIQNSGTTDVYGKFFGGVTSIEGGTFNWNDTATRLGSSILSVYGGRINISGALRLTEYDLIGQTATFNLASGGSVDIAGGALFLDAKDMLITPRSNLGNISQSDGYFVISGADITLYTPVIERSGGVMMLNNMARARIDAGMGNTTGGDIFLSNSTLDITDGNLNIGAGTGTIATTSGLLAMGDNATISALDGAIQTHTFAGNFAIFSIDPTATNSTANFAVDLDAQTFQSDRFVFAGTAMPGDVLLEEIPFANINEIAAMDAVVMLSDLNLINSPRTEVVPFTIMEASNFDPSIEFMAYASTVSTAAGIYSLISLGEGNFELRMESINPQAPRGGISHRSRLMSQHMVNSAMFDHIFVDSTVCISECQYAPWQFQYYQTGVFTRVFGGTDRIDLSDGMGSVTSDSFGVIVGIDLDSQLLGRHDWSPRWVPTFYLAYSGSQQRFQGVKQRQNGLQLGMQNTFSDGDFMGAILTYAGFYNNNINVEDTSDSTNSWFAGVGAKLAYNQRVEALNLIIQPNLMGVYNYIGSKTWDSNFGNVDMRTGSLSGFSMAPGVSFIFGLENFNVNLSARYMMNFVNSPAQTIGEIDLPEIEMPNNYFEFGLGLVGSLADRLTIDVTTALRTGSDITGVSGRIGIAYRF